MEHVVLECHSDETYRAFCHEDCCKNDEAVVDSNKPDRFVFYCDLGMTKKMHNKIMNIKKKSRYDIRWLPDDAWDRYVSELEKCGKEVPERTVRI